MLVRIRFGEGQPLRRGKGKNRRLALALASLLVPASVMALALALWRLAADMRYAAEFAIASGPFSHWQVWIGVAALLLFFADRLNRYGRGQSASRKPPG